MQDFFFFGIISAIALAFVVIKGILFALYYYNLDVDNEIISKNESRNRVAFKKAQAQQSSIDVVNNWRVDLGDASIPSASGGYGTTLPKSTTPTRTTPRRTTPTPAYGIGAALPPSQRVPLASSDLEVLDSYVPSSHPEPPTPSYIYDSRIGGTIV